VNPVGAGTNLLGRIASAIDAITDVGTTHSYTPKLFHMSNIFKNSEIYCL
jgi:hypothetical protein